MTVFRALSLSFGSIYQQCFVNNPNFMAIPAFPFTLVIERVSF